MLSGKEIKKNIGTNIIIDPYDEKRINPNSYNLRLDNKLLVYDSGFTHHTMYSYDQWNRNYAATPSLFQLPLDMKKENTMKELIIPDDGLIIYPGILYLGKTVEYTYTKNYVPMLEGRSSIGRLGMFVHVTAGFGDVGFSGYWTLEIQCVQPIKIYPYIDVCQIYYHEIIGEYDEYSKNGKYQNNTGIQTSMMYKDFI